MKQSYQRGTGVLLRSTYLFGLPSYEVFYKGLKRGHVLKQSMHSKASWAAVCTEDKDFDEYDSPEYVFATRTAAVQRLIEVSEEELK